MENQTELDKDTKTTGVLKAAWLIAVVTIVSKLIGFVRDVVIANYYGATMVSDAYYYAYQIPSLSLILLGGVGGPFHSATVAIFSKLIPSLKEKPSDKVNKLYSTFMTATILFFLVLSVLIFIFPKEIMGLIISNGSAEIINLSALHLKIMTPLLIIGGIVGIYYGILIIYKQFMLPNLSPIIMSVAIIAMSAIAAPDDKKGLALAWATTIGAILQLVIQYPNIRKLGFKLRPNFEFTNNPHFKEICELLFPAVLSSTVGQIHIYVDMFFTSSISEGAWTAIGYANRVFQFPVGILTTAFLVPLFPIFARLVADKDYDGIRKYFNKGVGVLFFAAIPIIMGQNIGTCATAMISSIGANKNAKRVAMVHLYFNIIGTVVILSVFYILNAIIGFPFISSNVVVDNADGRRFQCTKSFDSCRRTPGNHSNVEFAM